MGLREQRVWEAFDGLSHDQKLAVVKVDPELYNAVAYLARYWESGHERKARILRKRREAK